MVGDRSNACTLRYVIAYFLCLFVDIRMSIVSGVCLLNTTFLCGGYDAVTLPGDVMFFVQFRIEAACAQLKDLFNRASKRGYNSVVSSVFTSYITRTSCIRY